MTAISDAPAGVDTERQVRDLLAAAHRIAVYDGLSEGTWNHFSYMVDDEMMLITPTDVHWADMEPDSLVLVDADKRAARTRGLQFYIGYRIHYPLHQARPDARAVLHAHPPYATALSLLEDATLISMSQNSSKFYGRVAINETFDEFGDPEEQGERLARAVGDKAVLFMRGHGVTVLAPTIEKAYTELYLLELACRSQILALSTGRPLRVFTDAESAQRAGTGPGDEESQRHFHTMRKHVCGHASTSG
jgi:ribulose-5-phosphate 4-epimerase/fuculose-1-phosphate aldolase